MEVHGVHGIPWIQWTSIDSKEFHGVNGFPRSQCISMESMDFRKIYVSAPKCQQALKMAENHEKLSYIFFAFLPPYIGVSGSLVYAKR